MYIDSLTITALVVFVIALALFIRFCIVAMCGVQTTLSNCRMGLSGAVGSSRHTSRPAPQICRSRSAR